MLKIYISILTLLIDWSQQQTLGYPLDAISDDSTQDLLYCYIRHLLMTLVAAADVYNYCRTSLILSSTARHDRGKFRDVPITV